MAMLLALVGVQHARLTIDIGEAQQPRDPERRRPAEQDSRSAGDEQEWRRHRLPGHPRRRCIEVHVERTQRATDLEPDSQEADADECERKDDERPQVFAMHGRQRARSQQAAAGSTADEIGGGARVPVRLSARRHSVADPQRFAHALPPSQI
jgi:hypothetical protein